MTPNDLTCTECRERLPWYMASSRSDGDWSAVKRHLAGCVDCRRAGASWEAIAAALDDEDHRIPADIHAADTWFTLRSRLPAQVLSPATTEGQADYLVGSRINSHGTGSRYTPVVAPQWTFHPTRHLALVAAAAVVALSLMLFGIFGAQLRHHKAPLVVASGTPTGCAADTLGATIPAGAVVLDISMTSPESGWAVGWISSSTAPVFDMSKAALMLHFQNCRWQPVDSTNFSGARLYSVSMSSATDGWAVGSNANGQLLVLHYIGGQWQAIHLSAGIASGSGNVAKLGTVVRMTSANDGWMMVDENKTHPNPGTGTFAYTLLHFQEGTWVPVPLTFDLSGAVIFTDIAAIEPDDCWVAGFGTGNLAGIDEFAVAHYHDGTWTTWTGPQLGVSDPVVYNVTLANPSDVWMAGSYGATGSTSLLLHFDGTQWTRENITSLPEQYGISAITAGSPTDLWVFPSVPWNTRSPSRSYSIAHYHNGTWTWDTVAGTVVSVDAAAFVSDSEGYAAVETSTSTGQLSSILLHYAGGVWSVIPSR